VTISTVTEGYEEEETTETETEEYYYVRNSSSNSTVEYSSEGEFTLDDILVDE